MRSGSRQIMTAARPNLLRVPRSNAGALRSRAPGSLRLNLLVDVRASPNNALLVLCVPVGQGGGTRTSDRSRPMLV